MSRELSDIEDWKDMFDVPFSRTKPDDAQVIDARGNLIYTAAQHEKHRALVRAIPFSSTSLTEKVYYTIKRAIIRLTPARYFFNRTIGARKCCA